LTIDPRIQDIIDIHIVDILETYGLLLSREWTKFLRGWFSTHFTQLWLSWKGLNNQIKIDAEPKLKTMITEYNAPNEVVFMQSDLGSYKVMAFSTKISDDQTEKSKVSIPRQEVIMQFIDNMVSNLQCLGEEADPSILLLPRFF
jgi:hypothetical protein